MKALVRAVGGPRDVSVGPNQHGSGSSDRAEHRELPRTSVSSVDPLNPIRPWSDVEGAGLAEIEQYRASIVQQGEHPPWAALGHHVEIGHATPEQRVSRAEVVANVQTRHLAAYCLRGSSILRNDTVAEDFAMQPRPSAPSWREGTRRRHRLSRDWAVRTRW